MKKHILLAIVCVALCSGVSSAAVYDYGPGAMSLNNGDWANDAHSGSYYYVRYEMYTYDDILTFRNKASDTDNRAGRLWIAPEGEYITQIEFDWQCSTQRMASAIFAHDPDGGINTIGTDTILFEASVPGSGSQVLTFTQTDNLRSIFAGFEGTPYAWFGANNSALATIKNIKITAVPEPITMTVLAMGALGLVRRRRR